MDTRAHNRIAGSLLPHISKRTIEDVNHALDNPSMPHFYFQNSYSRQLGSGYSNPYDAMGLAHGHRQVNHDPVSASYAGYMAGGYEGARVAMVHLMLDKYSDNLKERYGARGRDLINAFLNYLE